MDHSGTSMARVKIYDLNNIKKFLVSFLKYCINLLQTVKNYVLSDMEPVFL